MPENPLFFQAVPIAQYFTSVNFSGASVANPDGDIVIDGIVLSNMSSLWEYS